MVSDYGAVWSVGSYFCGKGQGELFARWELVEGGVGGLVPDDSFSLEFSIGGLDIEQVVGDFIGHFDILEGGCSGIGYGDGVEEDVSRRGVSAVEVSDGFSDFGFCATPDGDFGGVVWCWG